jgi:hypothetical protein
LRLGKPIFPDCWKTGPDRVPTEKFLKIVLYGTRNVRFDERITEMVPE